MAATISGIAAFADPAAAKSDFEISGMPSGERRACPWPLAIPLDRFPIRLAEAPTECNEAKPALP